MTTLTLTNENFTSEVLNSETPVVVDFWAVWCGPCRVMNPIVSELAETFAGVVKVGKVNIDDYAELASQYQITAIPTLIIFEQGQEIQRIAGLISKTALFERVQALTQMQAA